MIGCSAAVFIFFWLKGFEGEWYPIQALMTNPHSVPIFGHRLLWVWLADAIKHLAPSLSYLRCFLLSQMAAAVLTIWMIGRWSALFVGRELQWIGQVLATMMLSLTFSYYTFYDISITFFFALCLLLLKQRMYVAFVIALTVATLNHENALLLIPIAGLETFSKRRLSAVLCSASAVAHFGVRAILQIFIPFHRQVDWRIWSNLHYPFAHPKEVALSVVSLLFWWIAAAMSWPSAGIFLKRCTLLFPLLFLVTYLVGQFHEARQFDAFIPVVIGFILSELAKHRE